MTFIGIEDFGHVALPQIDLFYENKVKVCHLQGLFLLFFSRQNAKTKYLDKLHKASISVYSLNVSPVTNLLFLYVVGCQLCE